MLVQTVNIVLMWVLGASLASFYGVVATRIPQGRSIVRPGSSCDGCNRKLDPLDLVPVLGYLLYRGKCKTCGASVPILFPVTEFFYGCTFVASYLHWGQYFFMKPDFLFFFIVSSIMLITLLTDIMYRKILFISNVLLEVAGLIYIFTTPEVSTASRFIEYAIVFGFFSILYVLFKQGGEKGLGEGDIRLYASLTFFLGASVVSVVLLASCFWAILTTAPFLRGSNSLRSYKIPFGAHTAFIVLMFYSLSIFDIVPIIETLTDMLSFY